MGTTQEQFQQQQYRGNNNQQAQQAAPKSVKIEVVAEEFKGTMKTEILNTMKLASIVNSIFKPVCADYDGSAITGDVCTGQFYLSLFFRDKGAAGEHQIKNIINAIRPTNNASPMDRINRMNIRNSNKTYDLTEDTKSILEEFIFTKGNQKVNWSHYMCEVSSQTNGGYQIYVKIGGIDIARILRKKYGKKADGSYYDYQVNMIRPLNQGYSNGDNTNFLINIVQLDTKKLEVLYQEMGMVPNQGSISFVKA